MQKLVGQSTPPIGGSAAAPATTTTDQHVYLRICKANILPQTGYGAPLSQNGHVYLIKGLVTDISIYAGSTVQWILEIAHLICDPLTKDGDLYTHPSGAAPDWFERDRTPAWQPLAADDPIRPGVYEYQPHGPISLSRLSERESASRTSTASRSSAATFRRELIDRDGMCIVSGNEPPAVVASHLIPRRVGRAGIVDIAERFEGAGESVGLDVYHPKTGALLSIALGYWVDRYLLGFHHVTGTTYTLHNFTDCPSMSLLGENTQTVSTAGLPRAHGHPVTLSHRSAAHPVPLPPAGVFRWHYLQCVVKRFGAREYWDIPGVKYHAYPFRTRSDSSDSEAVDDEPPYPTYRADQYLQGQREQQRALERRGEVSERASGVPSSSRGE